ncbi:zinc finger protein 608-like [Gouania willdenowi]|uniref:zinc finger protein 608-like n=1 Tax=Gouania willdenowi TaxID=441366 RepID=UPI00105422BD|nr:zinc finger protein 608-like [Gouania willdenowi]
MYSEHRMDLQRKKKQKLLQKEESFQTNESTNVDFMFAVPDLPPHGHHGDPGTTAFTSFGPSAHLTSSQKQLGVRTSPSGTDTQDGGLSGDLSGGPSVPLDGNSSLFELCQPGTSVNLEGIVWHETIEDGILVVEVKWRNRTYVGTLMDTTKTDWAPSKFCVSSSSDSHLPGGSGRRKRKR